jgi:hypothetical protein
VGRPILSGDAAADLTYGMRGLIRQAHHGYAYRVHTLTDDWNLNDVHCFYGTSAVIAWAVVCPCHLSADVSTVRLVVRAANDVGTTGEVRLRVYDGNSSVTSSLQTLTTTPTTYTLTVALSVETGGIGYCGVEYDANQATGVTIYGYVIQEIVLTSGELPT